MLVTGASRGHILANVLTSFYNFVGRNSQSQPTSKACICKFLSARKIGGSDNCKFYDYFSHVFRAKGSLILLITLFRRSPKTTYLSTRPPSETFYQSIDTISEPIQHIEGLRCMLQYPLWLQYHDLGFFPKNHY